MRLLRRKKGVLLGVFSDAHVGSVVGLRVPVVYSDDGGEHHYNEIQELLWNSFNDMADVFRRFKKETGWPLVLIHNGDLVDGNHHGTHEIWTQDELLMCEVARDTMRPIFDQADAIFMTRGTPSHVGKLARWEEQIASDLELEGYPMRTAKYRATWQHLNLMLNDVLFDVHHSPESRSYVPHTAGAEVNRISNWLGQEYSATGDRIPDVALRAHTHGFRDSGTTHRTRTFITPPWSQVNEYAANRKWAGKVTPVGGLLFVIPPEPKDEYSLPYEFKRIKYAPRRDPPEVIYGQDLI